MIRLGVAHHNTNIILRNRSAFFYHALGLNFDALKAGTIAVFPQTENLRFSISTWPVLSCEYSHKK